MEENKRFRYSPWDVLLTLMGLGLFLTDVVLDLWAVNQFYGDGAYGFMGVLLFLLVGSAVLLQVFSWMLYADYCHSTQTSVEKFVVKHNLLKILHLLQLGTFLRYVGVVEITVRRFRKRGHLSPEQTENFAAYLIHDLQLLRLIETFAESAPQLILMFIAMLHKELELWSVLKASASACAIAFSILAYHCSMRGFSRDKHKMGWTSSVPYFLWNLFLIGPRVVTLAAFASVLPCYVVAHFLSVWVLLVFWAWWQKTDLMDSPAGEWLYRATLGLIWYFSWFNVAEGQTMRSSVIYHTAVAVDSGLLLTLWWWRRASMQDCLGPLAMSPYVLLTFVALSYFIGIILKGVYYKFFHPKIDHHDDSETPVCVPQPASLARWEPDSQVSVEVQDPPSFKSSAPSPLTGVNKRMRNLVSNFYS